MFVFICVCVGFSYTFGIIYNEIDHGIRHDASDLQWTEMKLTDKYVDQVPGFLGRDITVYRMVFDNYSYGAISHEEYDAYNIGDTVQCGVYAKYNSIDRIRKVVE